MIISSILVVKIFALIGAFFTAHKGGKTCYKGYCIIKDKSKKNFRR